MIVGFNDFCSPSLDEALATAAAKKTGKVIVLTTMMTRGGEHAEKEIPAAIQRARERYPEVCITYVWPFDCSKVAEFMADQIP